MCEWRPAQIQATATTHTAKWGTRGQVTLKLMAHSPPGNRTCTGNLSSRPGWDFKESVGTSFLRVAWHGIKWMGSNASKNHGTHRCEPSLNKKKKVIFNSPGKFISCSTIQMTFTGPSSWGQVTKCWKAFEDMPPSGASPITLSHWVSLVCSKQEE